MVLIFIFSCQPKQQPVEEEMVDLETEELGEVHLSVEGDEKAMPAFEKGLLLLHSFEYVDAREAFQEAIEIDSGFVMAIWGEAMTHNHPLWRQQNVEKGQAALKQLGATKAERLAKIENDLERAFVEAVEILYSDEGEKKERDQLYSKHLEKMYQEYPGNQEIASFYALSLLGAVPVGRDEAMYEMGATIAKGILQENPNHPGALHYLIHSYDDPGHAKMALHAANSYSKVAPDAAHALHMPSHIYVAMGMWKEVVLSNIASWEASVKRMERKELGNDAMSYHALHWLMYGYLQQGKHAKSKELLEHMLRYAKEEPSKRARDYWVSMKGNYLVESGDWAFELDDSDINLKDLSIVVRATYNYLEGKKAYRRTDLDQLKLLLDAMKKDRISARTIASNEAPPMCKAGITNRYLPNQLDIDQAHIMEMELMGLKADLEKDLEEAEKWLKAATGLQSKISYSYGPPPIIEPSYELYGDWLLSQNRPEDALLQYEYALNKGPKRVSALSGYMKAAKLSGKKVELYEKKKVLEAVLKEADEAVKANYLGSEVMSLLQ